MFVQTAKIIGPSICTALHQPVFRAAGSMLLQYLQYWTGLNLQARNGHSHTCPPRFQQTLRSIVPLEGSSDHVTRVDEGYPAERTKRNVILTIFDKQKQEDIQHTVVSRHQMPLTEVLYFRVLKFSLELSLDDPFWQLFFVACDASTSAVHVPDLPRNGQMPYCAMAIFFCQVAEETLKPKWGKCRRPWRSRLRPPKPPFLFQHPMDIMCTCKSKFLFFHWTTLQCKDLKNPLQWEASAEFVSVGHLTAWCTWTHVRSRPLADWNWLILIVWRKVQHNVHTSDLYFEESSKFMPC